MFTCEMEGCDDMATYEVELRGGEILTVCADCSEYWANGGNGYVGIMHVKKFAGVA